MKRKNIVVVMMVLISLMFVFASESGSNSVNIIPLDLSSEQTDVLPGSDVKGVKPDIDFGKIPLYFVPNQGQVNEKEAVCVGAWR